MEGDYGKLWRVPGTMIIQVLLYDTLDNDDDDNAKSNKFKAQ